jgi:hypothetical protein
MCNGLDEACTADKSAQRPTAARRLMPGRSTRSYRRRQLRRRLAQHLLYADVTNSYRIRTRSRPPFIAGIFRISRLTPVRPARPASIPAFLARKWGLPWRTNVRLPGLAYTIGGRSLFFGGWSPRLLDEEMPPAMAAQRRQSTEAKAFR